MHHYKRKLNCRIIFWLTESWYGSGWSFKIKSRTGQKSSSNPVICSTQNRVQAWISSSRLKVWAAKSTSCASSNERKSRLALYKYLQKKFIKSNKWYIKQQTSKWCQKCQISHFQTQPWHCPCLQAGFSSFSHSKTLWSSFYFSSKQRSGICKPYAEIYYYRNTWYTLLLFFNTLSPTLTSQSVSMPSSCICWRSLVTVSKSIRSDWSPKHFTWICVLILIGSYFVNKFAKRINKENYYFCARTII